jgi:peptidoglycan/LPS O-acetylase OafA/YrhL
MKDSANLDFLRAWAVAAVFLNHLFYTFGNRGNWFLDTRFLGRAGVLVFFVHTSLVLMLSMRRTASIAHPALHFYVRRAFRIYPLSIVCVTAYVVAGLPPDLWESARRISPLVMASNLLLMQNLTGGFSVLSPLWSLPFEIQMYVVLPLVYAAARRGRSAAVAMILGSVGACGVLKVLTADYALGLIAYAPYFLAGVLAFTMLSGRKRWNGGWWIVAVLGSMAGATVVMNVLKHGVTIAGWCLCLALGVLIPQFEEIRSHWVRAASHTVAKYSYSIYLSHVPAMWIAVHISNRFPVQLAGVGFFTVALSLAAYHGIEAPMIGIGKRVADGAFARRAPVAAVK